MQAIRSLLARSSLLNLIAIALLAVALALRLFALEAFPPGVQHDEVFVANFAETVLQGTYPIFFELNRGNEPLFMYLVAGAFKLFGENVWALRGTAALCGFGALVLTWLLAKEMFGPARDPLSSDRDTKNESGDFIALVVVAGITFSFWHLYESRIGLHAISTYLLAAATFYAFWHGWTRGKRLWLIASGILAGLATYTYRSGIFVPVCLVVFILYALVLHRTRWGRNWWIAPLIIAIAVIIYTPLGYFIFTHPDTALARVGDLAGDVGALRQGNPLPLMSNAVRVFGLFGVSGDPEWRYNIAGRPIFDPVWAVLFYGGVLLALWRFKRAPYAFALTWLVGMLLPSIVTGSDLSQHRAVGAIGAAFIFPALALDAIRVWIQARWGGSGNVGAEYERTKWRWATALPYAIAGVLIVLAAVEGVYAYFVTWTRNPEVRLIQRADLAEAARWLENNPVEQGTRILVSAEFAGDLDRGSFNLEAGGSLHPQFLNGQDTFVLPEQDTVLVNTRSGAIAADLSDKFLGGVQPIYRVPLDAATNELEVSRLDPIRLERLGNTGPKGGSLGDLSDAQKNVVAQIYGAEPVQPIAAGERLRPRVWWRIINPAFQDEDQLTWYLSLTDDQGYVWSQASNTGFTPSQWQKLDTVVSAFDIEVPADAPPRNYFLELSLSSKNGPLLIDQYGGDKPPVASLRVGSVKVTRGPVPEAKPDLPVRYPSKAKFGDAIQLLGSDAVGEATAGQPWRLVLFWKANDEISANYALRLTAATENGQEIARQQDTLLKGYYSTKQWRAGDYIRSIHNLVIPADAPRGKAVVRISMWTPDGKPVGRADGVPIAGIDIAGRTRNFTRPSPQTPMTARLGNSIELIGYDVAPPTLRAGEPMTVTLFWHALDPADKPYTVFVHLLNSTNQVIGQKDSPPLEGQAPTESWQKDEYVVDTYTFSVAQDAVGSAAVEMGMYDPATSRRLAVYDAQGAPIGDRVLIQGLSIAR